MPLAKKITKDVKLVNIHQVTGDLGVIEFLKNADFHWVEGLFLRAKQIGSIDFEYQGQRYRLARNRNLTYTVERVPDQPTSVENI